MVDRFELDHPRIVLSPEKSTIRNETVSECFLPLMTLPIAMSYWGILGTSNKRVRSLEVAFLALIEETLGYYEMHEELLPHEQRIAEAIILHRVQLAIEEGPLSAHPDSMSWNPVLGVMIQQRFTLALAELDLASITRIRNLADGFLPSGSKEWSKALVGASSASRVLEAAHDLEGACVFLPTVYEDRVYGIDLF